MPSFDVVSEVDIHEIQNAIDQANREIDARYDFKNANAKVEKADDTTLQLNALTEFQIKQMQDILFKKLAKRGLDVQCLDEKEIEASGTQARQKILIRQGIDKELAKKINKLVKDSDLKVQASIQGEQVRITGKKRDDLQAAIAMLRGANLGIPLQFTNFRD